MLSFKFSFSTNLHILFFISFLSLSSADVIVPYYVGHQCSNEADNFTINSTYETNLKTLFASLSSSNATYDTGFYNTTAGQSPDKVYGHFLCRGDVNTEICKGCVTFATSYIFQLCPVQKEAIHWYEKCMLRYSYRSIFSSLDRNGLMWMSGNDDITGPLQDGFDQQLNSLMNGLATEAANTSKKFAEKAISLPVPFLSLYGLVQCTPDQSSADCNSCLRQLINTLPTCCSRKQSGNVITPSCNVQYKLKPFFNSFNAPPKGKQGSRRTWIALGASFSTTLAIALLGSCIFLMWRRNKLKKEDKENSQDVHLLYLGEDRFRDYHSNRKMLDGEKLAKSQEFPLIRLDIVDEATKHFSYDNKLGEGGFGPVYKGTLADGKEIAVKRLSKTSGQGLTELKNEVTLIARLQHRNLVRLLGCCLEKNEKLLIYEYMPNKSLDVFIFDSGMSVQLDWQKRLSIIYGIARGILYLHEDSRLRIIHRDLKTSNILLDHEMNPKISDFGMARIFGGNQSEANTNRVVGTYGYMAPEYAMEGLFSVKSDVFSFGVLLLEIISGRKNNGFHLSEHGESLLTFAWKLWSKNQGMELMDPLLRQSCVADGEVLKCIHIGLLCVQEDAADRPTMSSVVVMLVSESITLPIPRQPAFSVGRVVSVSTSNDKVCSVNGVTISDMSPR